MISQPWMQVLLQKETALPPSKLGVRAQNYHIILLDFHNLQHFSEISGKENK